MTRFCSPWCVSPVRPGKIVSMRFVIFVMALLVLFPKTVPAAELVMFDSPACEWCELWEEEVGIIYGKTEEARGIPLRRIGIDDPRPPGLGIIRPVIYTPTFVLISGGHEVGRITGYPGEAHFWSLFEALAGTLERPIFGCGQRPKTANREAPLARENGVC